jgi:hypothetical protein
MRVRARAPKIHASSSRDEALDAVDTALSFANRRKLLTAPEAMDLLSAVRNKVPDPQIEAIVDAAMAAAEHAASDDALIDRSVVIDQLLDLRLTIAR